MDENLATWLGWPLIAHACGDTGGCIQCGLCYVGIGSWYTGLAGSTFDPLSIVNGIAAHARICASPNALVTPITPIAPLRAVTNLEDTHA